jgi:hypothetical protein
MRRAASIFVLVSALVGCGDVCGPEDGGTDTDARVVSDAATDASASADAERAPGSDAGGGVDSSSPAPLDGGDRRCPDARDARCGSACETPETMCLCTRGGGFDFVPCDCAGGTWTCSGG